MKDRQLIEEMIAGTLPRIKDISDFYTQQAEKELSAQIAAGEWPELAGTTPPAPDPEREAEITGWLWRPILSHVAVHLIWAITAQATDGEIAVDETSVATACATITDAELKRGTGLRDEHIRPVLEKMAEALIEVVRADGEIEIDIDRQPFRLRAVP